MFQRLQQRMNRKKVVQETEPELSSFYPDTEDGTILPLSEDCDVILQHRWDFNSELIPSS